MLLHASCVHALTRFMYTCSYTLHVYMLLQVIDEHVYKNRHFAERDFNLSSPSALAAPAMRVAMRVASTTGVGSKGNANCSACGFEAMCASADTPGDCHWCPNTKSTVTRCYAKGTACPSSNGDASSLDHEHDDASSAAPREARQSPKRGHFLGRLLARRGW
jgi:hypothetical protein